MSEKKTPNLGTLRAELINVWCNERPLKYFRNLSDSMPRCLKMVIKNKGNMTKY